MRIYLIRHGEMAGDPHQHYEPPVANCLSPLGCEQAESLAGRLVDVPFTAIYSSPLGRAIQTAQPMAKACGLPVELLPWIIEWRPATVLGRCSDANYEEIERAAAQVRPEAAWETGAGESTLEMAGRIIPGFLQLMQKHGVLAAHGGYLLNDEAENQCLALVAHGGSLACLTAFLLGIPLQPYAPVSFSHTGVAVFDFTWRVDVWYPVMKIPALA